MNKSILLTIIVLMSQSIRAYDMDARFIVKSDPKTHVVADIPLRNTWWSRGYEYAWAMQFVGDDLIVLDAACGISHPLKWYLAENCNITWACDIDTRITDQDRIIQETLDDLGNAARTALVGKKDIFSKINLVYASILRLPRSLPLFDRIFCISTLEHLSEYDQKRTLYEFKQFLAKDGLIVLTVDYPTITPECLMAYCNEVGLRIVGNPQLGVPGSDAVTSEGLCVYRCLVTHKE